jgi:hypothetical protein
VLQIVQNKINSTQTMVSTDAPELQTISFNGRVSEKLVQELSYSMIKWISLKKR